MIATKEGEKTTQIDEEKPRPDKTRKENLWKPKSKPQQDERENEEQMETERAHRSLRDRQAGDQKTRSSYPSLREVTAEKSMSVYITDTVTFSSSREHH